MPTMLEKAEAKLGKLNGNVQQRLASAVARSVNYDHENGELPLSPSELYQEYQVNTSAMIDSLVVLDKRSAQVFLKEDLGIMQSINQVRTTLTKLKYKELFDRDITLYKNKHILTYGEVKFFYESHMDIDIPPGILELSG